MAQGYGQEKVLDKYEATTLPMIEIVRADGPLRASFDETERLLHRAREEALFNDHPALARGLRFLRLVGDHALRVFTQRRKEIQPLYVSLRRSSFIAEGAALALEKLEAEGLSKWSGEYVVNVATWRYQNVPSDAAIALALRRVIEHPPAPAPVLEFVAERDDPAALIHLLWLDSLPDLVRADLPVEDLMQWLVSKHPGRKTSDVLAGFSGLLYHREFRAAFTEQEPRSYTTTDGEIMGSPLILTSA